MTRITLYHGTYHLFDKVDVLKGNGFKDFGKGFYTSKFESHAIDMAKRNAQIESKRIKEFKLDLPNPNAYLYTYQFDEEKLKELAVKEFDVANTEWVRFITYNRKNKIHKHNYDIVIGPTANDQTMPTVNAFLIGAYGNIDDEEAIKTFLKQIEPYKLPPQFYFATQQAGDLLEFVERREL